MKNLKFLLLAAALLAGGASAYADNSTLSALSKSSAQLSIPAATASDASSTPLKKASSGGSYFDNCTQNDALMPGSDFSPHIDDAVRTQAIKDLLTKIANCESLPYSQDGVVNDNREGQMPQEAAGYYHEFTLIVPGRQTGDGTTQVVIGGQTYTTGTMQSARGPERIIIGANNEIYYTMDHYTTFLRLTIVP
jgi:guanyl-specific ribonuclease Sa